VRSHDLTLDPSKCLNICGAPGGEWQMEGTTTAAGQGYRWFRDALCAPEIEIAKNEEMDVYDHLNEQAAKVPAGCNGLMFLPYLCGAETPKFNRYARGAFIGMNLQHRKGDFVRAVMEGSTYELKSVMEVFKNAGLPLGTYRFSGGGSRSALWNQIVADVFNVPISNVGTSESTCLGAAMIAAVGVGLYKDYKEAAASMVRITKSWEPQKKNVAIYQEGYEMMQDCYKTLTDSGMFRRIFDFEHK
jgi:xylulokinase